jgi:DNA-binding transcriptional regulator YiaG
MSAKPKARKKDEISPTIARMVAGIHDLCNRLEAGEPLEKIAKVTWVRRPIEMSEYGPDQLRTLRTKLQATQHDLATFLGVSLATVRSWEQGQRPVPNIARRYLDDIQAYPQLWVDRMVRPI